MSFLNLFLYLCTNFIKNNNMKQLFITLFLLFSIITKTNYEKEINKIVIEKPVINEWTLISEKVEGTVYNAVNEQCDDDPLYTASMFRLNLSDVFSHKIIAMERTFMKELNLVYGDVVKIEGTGNLDGVWQIQDTMNKKFAGRKKIDFLVPTNIKTGKWDNIKLYVLTNKENTHIYLNNMAPQAKNKKS